MFGEYFSTYNLGDLSKKCYALAFLASDELAKINKPFFKTSNTDFIQAQCLMKLKGSLKLLK